jgi:ribosomal protein L12E/L44/L45/RPP1/RPP2
MQTPKPPARSRRLGLVALLAAGSFALAACPAAEDAEQDDAPQEAPAEEAPAEEAPAEEEPAEEGG